MNSSTFKANVHLNIVSFASLLYFRHQRRQTLFADRMSLAQSVVEVHFVKMQTFEQKVRLSNVCFFLFFFLQQQQGPSQAQVWFCVLSVRKSARRLSQRLSTGLQ